MDKSTLIRHLGSLEKAGLIRRDSRRRENGSQTSTAYLLHLAPAPKETGCRNSQQSPVADCNTPCGKTQQGPVAKCDPHNLGNEEDDDDDDGDRDATAPLTDLQGTAPAKPQKQKSPSKIVGGLYDGCRSLDQEFERVWAQQPRKVGKGAARSAWGRARSKASFEEIARPLALWIEPMMVTSDIDVLSFCDGFNTHHIGTL